MKYGDDDMSIPIIIDTDPGIDDATAISIALSHPQFDVKMISTVNGNVGIEKTTANALKLKRFFNSSVPVHRGASQPLINDIFEATSIHGESGMDGYEFPQINQDDLFLEDDNENTMIYGFILNAEELDRENGLHIF